MHTIVNIHEGAGKPIALLSLIPEETNKTKRRAEIRRVKNSTAYSRSQPVRFNNFNRFFNKFNHFAAKQ
jgi:hypothetical protein